MCFTFLWFKNQNKLIQNSKEPVWRLSNTSNQRLAIKKHTKQSRKELTFFCSTENIKINQFKKSQIGKQWKSVVLLPWCSLSFCVWSPFNTLNKFYFYEICFKNTEKQLRKLRNWVMFHHSKCCVDSKKNDNYAKLMLSLSFFNMGTILWVKPQPDIPRSLEKIPFMLTDSHFSTCQKFTEKYANSYWDTVQQEVKQ